MERVASRRLYPELIAQGGETNKFIDYMGERGVTHLVLLNGNCATHYKEMFNNMVGTAQWQIDRIRAEFPEAVIGVGFNSDTDALLMSDANTNLHPSTTGMDEITRASYVLDALHAQFNERADGNNIPVAAYLYEGNPVTRDSGVEELKAVMDAGFFTAASKSTPWNLPHPFGSPVWFGSVVNQYSITAQANPEQGSIMERFDRSARIAALGDSVTPEIIQAVSELVESGSVVNLYNRDIVLFGKDKQPILDASDQPFIIKPQIGPHGKPYMVADKPHHSLFPTTEALNDVPHYQFPEA